MPIPRQTFRFGVSMSSAVPHAEWRTVARRIEQLGYSTLLLQDHLGNQLSPLSALSAAADATSIIRIGGFVFCNDFRHPVLLAREAASLDCLSNGRLEFGLGAGWRRAEYEQAGIAFDRPSVRIERLEEACQVIKGLFAGGRFSFSGKHYQIDNLEGWPQPVQSPPPILIGGGGRRLLTLAAREANIVGLTPPASASNNFDVTRATAAAVTEQVGWIREAAGDRFDQLELNVLVFLVAVTPDRQAVAAAIGGRYGAPPTEVLASPYVLAGTIDEIVDDLQARRERFGISYIVIPGDNFEAFAPVVARLNGT